MEVFFKEINMFQENKTNRSLQLFLISIAHKYFHMPFITTIIGMHTHLPFQYF